MQLGRPATRLRLGLQDQPILKRWKLRLRERKAFAEVAQLGRVCCQDLLLSRQDFADSCPLPTVPQSQATPIHRDQTYPSRALGRPSPFRKPRAVQIGLQGWLNWAAVKCLVPTGARRYVEGSLHLSTWPHSPRTRREFRGAAACVRVLSRVP